MIRTPLLLLGVAALAACAAATPRPLSVAASPGGIEVAMSNGRICRGPAPAGAASGWSGTLQGCPTPYVYSVEIDPGTNPLRLLLDELFTALGAPDLIGPMATVAITDGNGRTRTFTPRGARDAD